MTDYGLVSIITPSYNCAGLIEETIKSILAQTYDNWELLITDDCSTDSTTQLLRKYSDLDSRIKIFYTDHNSGAGVARNKSISEAQGRFIAFCDGDDRWLPCKLEKQLKFMVENSYGLTYTSYITCNETGKYNGYVKCLPSITYAKILRDNGIGCLTAIYDTRIVGKRLMPSIRKRQDWCLWIDIIKNYGPAYGLDIPLALYRIREGSVSSSKVKLLKYNFSVYHDVLGFNRLYSILMLGGLFLPYYIYKKVKQTKDSKNFDYSKINL